MFRVDDRVYPGRRAKLEEPLLDKPKGMKWRRFHPRRGFGSHAGLSGALKASPLQNLRELVILLRLKQAAAERLDS